MKLNELDDETLKRSTYKLTHGNYRAVQRVIQSVKQQSGITLNQAEVVNLILEANPVETAYKTTIALYVQEKKREARSAEERSKLLEELTAGNPGLVDKLANADPEKLKLLLESL